MDSLFLCILGKRSKDRSQSQKAFSEGKVSRGEVLDEQEAKTVVVRSKGFFNLGRHVLVGDQVLVVDNDGFVLWGGKNVRDTREISKKVNVS